MKRGDIYWAELIPRSGSEQTGRRPVIVISHDAFNLTPGWKSAVVIPISTSRTQGNRGPSAVEIPDGLGGLSQSSFALCHQITTLDRSKLSKRLGALPKEIIENVEEGIRAALDLA